MKLQTYLAISLLGALAAVYHSFKSRGQFYPAMVHLSTSKTSGAVLLNMGLVLMILLWQLIKKVFLGSLREAEVERLQERSWAEIMEILFAITVFRQEFSVLFLVMVTTLLMIKSLNWLAQKRVEYIETTPYISMLSHICIGSFMGFLLLIDSFFLYNSVNHLVKTRKASVSLFFAFEYMVLSLTTASTIVKYIFNVSDMLMQGQWEKKAACTFYLELIRDLLHLALCMCFFLVVFMNYGVPLHLIRDLYETFLKFKTRVADYIRYRKIASNMNIQFPDATAEELNESDATCIICREEMTVAKKLACGHLFHVPCLRSWLERQNTCPTCRSAIAPPQNGTSLTASRTRTQQQGTRTAGTSSQGSNADGEENNTISQPHAKLQAATSAAMLYGKSFVYPSPTLRIRSPEHSLLPQTFGHPTITQIANNSMEGDASGLSPHSQLINNSMKGDASGLSPQSQFANTMVAPSPSTFAPLYINGQFSPGSASDFDLDRQRRLIENQIENLQNQMQQLQTYTGDLGSSDVKGKSVSSPSSSVTATSKI